MVLKLRASHFDATQFHNGTCCPIATAIKQEIPMSRVIEGVNEVSINDIRYTHERYTSDEYAEDYRKAAEFHFSPEIYVRTLNLEVYGTERRLAKLESSISYSIGSDI